jgi:hypothetical protein
VRLRSECEAFSFLANLQIVVFQGGCWLTTRAYISISHRPTHAHSLARTHTTFCPVDYAVFPHTQDYEGRGEAGKYSVQFISKSADGIAHYLKHHAAKAREALKPFTTNATFKRRVLKMTRQIFPAPNTRGMQSAMPSEPKLLGSSRRPLTADAFQGAYGKKSDQSEFSTTRYVASHPFAISVLV